MSSCIRPITGMLRLQVEGAFYSYASPTATNTEPSTVAFSPGMPHISGSNGFALCAAASVFIPVPPMLGHLSRPMPQQAACL